jgi:hypothetical protein
MQTIISKSGLTAPRPTATQGDFIATQLLMHRACNRSAAQGNCFRIDDSRLTYGNGNQHTMTSKLMLQGMLVLFSSEVLPFPLPSVAAPHIEL